jgi:hypothetical protein
MVHGSGGHIVIRGTHHFTIQLYFGLNKAINKKAAFYDTTLFF